MRNKEQKALNCSKRSSKNICRDQQCKNILKYKQILAAILQAYIPEYEKCTREEVFDCIEKQISNIPKSPSDTIVGKDSEDNYFKDSMVRYDVLFDTSLPGANKDSMEINIEAQNKSNPGYPIVTRGLYYCCRRISCQKNGPDGFTKSEYGKIKKVYSIWFCLDAPAGLAGSAVEYSVVPNTIFGKIRKILTGHDILKTIIIYPKAKYDLNTKYTDPKEQVMAMIRVLFDPTISAEDKKCYLAEKCDIIITKEIGEEIDKMTEFIQSIKEEGIKEGIKEGVKIGVKQGMFEASLELVANYIKKHNVNVEEALQEIGIADEFRTKIKEQLEK